MSVALEGVTVVIGAGGDDHSDMTSAGAVSPFSLTHSAIPVFSDSFASGCTSEWSTCSP